MTPTDLATRLLALDWSATSLQHQLAVTAAVLTLRNLERETPMPDPLATADPKPTATVLPFPAPSRPKVAPEIRHITLLHLDGRLFATAGFLGRGGCNDVWSWVQEVVAAELGVGEEAVGCLEDPEGDGDLVTADGLPVYRIVHGIVASAPGVPVS